MNDCIHGTDIPTDGASLRQALHQKGINLRYLGHLIESINQSDLKHQLRHITVNAFKIQYIGRDLTFKKHLNHILHLSQRLAFAEIVVRCAQRFFSGYIQVFLFTESIC